MQRGGHQFVGSCVLQASAVEYQLAPTDTSVDTTLTSWSRVGWKSTNFGFFHEGVNKRPTIN